MRGCVPCEETDELVLEDEDDSDAKLLSATACMEQDGLAVLHTVH